MQSFIALPTPDRRTHFEQAQARLGLSAASVEKDFWVCWTLRELFSLEDWGPALTFKGGTSLSKGWGLIERFSEDIDVVVDREFLGFGGGDNPAMAPSRKQLKMRIEALKKECCRRIQDELLLSLRQRLRERLTWAKPWSLEPDPNDPEGQTLLFGYPGVFSAGVYLNPIVRIELGARSDTEPSESPEIHPCLADSFPDLMVSCRFPVRSVVPERTFWEKAVLLHEEIHRPVTGKRRPRLARHYYDLWCLIRKGVADRAVADVRLFGRVVEHQKVFFRQNWMDYDTLAPGGLRLVPTDEQITYWRNDYRAMRDVMFFGDPPGFDEVMRVVGEFERRFNQD